jgi:hypothetical protein
MVRYEAHFRKNLEVVNGMEAYIQGREDEGDNEMVVFFGEADPRAIEDWKRLKWSIKKQSAGLVGAIVY